MMGTFNYTHTVAYQNNSFLGTQGPFNLTIDDGDVDSTFEVGDTVTTQSAGYTYAGTFSIDGTDWPAFTYTTDPQFVVVFMDQQPVSPPGTFSANGATANVACFGPDTRITTENGDVLVQDLKVGDSLVTADGATARVHWLSVISRPTAIAGRSLDAVRIRAGALGNGLPQSDLTVTADHGMILEGLVINASALVNGTTIDFVPLAELGQRVTYYHIETEGHDVILANGAPAETFVDVAGRQGFDNYAEYLELYGVERVIPEMRAHRITTQRLLPDAIRTRLGIAEKEIPDFSLTA
ncbi:Hint domain-containing protein [Primorskyibacter sp. 2E107]|uniref:Hint domain-containing protein n=1 Tax=Primorskyibacter sp. 2E107 TaxID=3403458 RepID=UPI003AF8C2B7